MENGNHEENMIRHAMDYMGVAVTIIDAECRILYYNERAEEILDRKPEYIGEDVRSHHTGPSSGRKFHEMIREFTQGRAEPFHYDASPYGQLLSVTFSPVVIDGKFSGGVQAVILKEDKTVISK